MKNFCALLLLLMLLPVLVLAQSIPIKTVPVATGDQFLLFPSRNLGMGGVSIALDDPWLDPFVNPAKGVNVRGMQFASAPVYYGISLNGLFGDDGGSGRTLPVGLLLNQGGFFGGAVFAFQELAVQEQRNDIFFSPTTETTIDDGSNSVDLSNRYVFGMAGLQVPGTQLSVGASIFLAGLNALEGVRLLYWDGNNVKQSGSMNRFRTGLYYATDAGHAAELTLLHHRFDMTHTRQRWSPELQNMVDVTEFDETRGWAVQAGYRHPVAEGTTVGLQLTGDWKTHPKIPNYDLMQIPRDPGNSSAYNIGVGAAWQRGQATFGVDLIYEPIRSHTWADAIAPIETPSGQTIARGEKTVENFFDFSNIRTRLGLHRAGDRVDFQLGLDVHAISYHLDQENFELEFTREQDESWTEWTGSAGLGLNFAEFQVRYLGLFTLGTGRPGVAASNRVVDFAGADFLVAATGPLTLQEARVVTHQISIIVPISD